jgi:hypothetical protein
MWSFAHTVARNRMSHQNPSPPKIQSSTQHKLPSPPPSLNKTNSLDNLLGGFFPFLTDDLPIQEYFDLKYDYYQDELANDMYVLHHIPEPGEMLYFLYDVEYYFRKAHGNQKVFREQLLKSKLYKLFNILVGTKIITPYPLDQQPEDKWEILAYQLLSAWHVHAECICLPPSADQILKLIQNEKKYSNFSS